MAKTQRKQRNKEAEAHGSFFSRPLDFSVFGLTRPNASTRLAFSVVQSLSLKGEYCEFTQKDFAERYHVSRATSARGFKKIVDSNVFERGEKVKQYKYIGENPTEKNAESKEYIRIYDWLYRAHFEIGNVRVQLTAVQVEILSFIRGYTFMNKNRIAQMSRNWIAKKLGISADCVAKNVIVLEATGILIISEKDGIKRSVNASTRTSFKINEVLWRQKEQATLKRRERQASQLVPDEAVRDADERSDRERYYAQRDAMEQKRIADMEKELARDERYVSAEEALRKSEIEEARAEINRDSAALMRILEKRLELENQKRERMSLYGYTEQDFLPQYLCADCKDTGNRANGTFCDCWRRLRR